ncbi:MAG: hypothetical protein FJ009_14030 [Chloroflexi bacterium]|nr:hypothetical protein [Chloroflexota bacterium]
MAMQEMVVRFPLQVLRGIDQIALEKKIKREQVVVGLVQESLRRERVRAQVFAAFERKRKSPEWQKATKQLAEFRKHVKRVPEAELEADINEAITAVRARQSQRG